MAMLPLTAERDAAVADLAKAVLSLEYLPCLESAIRDLRRELDRERERCAKAEQDVITQRARIKTLERQLDEAKRGTPPPP